MQTNVATYSHALLSIGSQTLVRIASPLASYFLTSSWYQITFSSFTQKPTEKPLKVHLISCLTLLYSFTRNFRCCSAFLLVTSRSICCNTPASNSSWLYTLTPRPLSSFWTSLEAVCVCVCTQYINGIRHCKIQGIVTYMSPVEAFVTAIKFFGRQKVCLIA